MRPDIGIVMPVYIQKEAYLRTAIRSVLQQSYRRFSLIIVIDGPLPEMEAIIQQEVQNDPRVRILRLAKNGGVSHALNRGFDILMAEDNIDYLTWVSSDNVYQKHFLKKLRHCISQGPDSRGLVFSSFQHIDGQGAPVREPNIVDFIKYQNKAKEELLDVCFIGVSFMYKKKYAQKAGQYFLEPVEDYDYWLRLTECCDIAFVPEILMEYRMDSEFSISKNLKTSLYEHRRWRYAFQLAKHRARMRRGIPFETTVIVPVMNDSDATIMRVEELYNQYYSNFIVLIVDFTAGGGAKKKLSSISDPRVAFVEKPGGNPRVVYNELFHSIRTPFTLIYDLSVMMDILDLHLLTLRLRATEPHVRSVYMNNNRGITNQTTVEASDPSPNRLYRTQMIRR